MTATSTAAFGGAVAGYGLIMCFLAHWLGELEFHRHHGRVERVPPMAALLSFTGLCAGAFGTIMLSAAIWP
jgi:hypothetical protein